LGEAARQGETEAALISAHTGQGMSELLALIDKHLMLDPVARQRFRFPVAEGRAMHLLHDRAAVISRVYTDDACEIVADAPQSIRNRLAAFAIE
jgi:50S ribosomal subunit-associated GTPase HflX